ncbi:MAG: cytochrome c [Verrucomicrobiota bacterium]
MRQVFRFCLAAFPALAVALGGGDNGHKQQLTFSEHVAPIVFENCSSCHRPKEAAPFSLLNYRDVQKRSELILTVIEERYMPPWHAESKDYTFQDHRGLSDEEIELIVEWVDSGMAEGDPSKLPELPAFTDSWQLGEPDLVVSMKEGYTLYAEGPDIYRNFVIPLNLGEDKWIQAIEFRPGARSIVHHSLFYYDTDGEALKRDRADPIPGFESMGRGQERDGSIGGWALGGNPRKLPEGLAYYLPQEEDLILSTHFHPSGKEETEVSTVGFYFADEPPSKRFTGIQLPPAFGALAGIDIPAGDGHYAKRDSFVLPVDVKAFGVSSHAHYLGKSMRMTATLPNGELKELMSIPEWDFSWQENYRYEDYVSLPAGTRLDAEVVWDNSEDNIHNPNVPPKRVTWGRESSDEMGSVTLQVIPSEQSDFRELRQALREHTSEARKSSRDRLTQSGGLRGEILKRALERFDEDGDGELNDAEREAAMEALRAFRRQRGQ